MPFSFTQIEKDRSFRIGAVLLFLVLFYFVVALLLYAASKFYFILKLSSHSSQDIYWGISFKEASFVLSVAIVTACCHFVVSALNTVQKILTLLNARPLDPRDTYHALFKNILDEVSVATGGVQIKGVVVPTMALNAFAIADFQGNVFIGVTEGLLNKLTRAQLETVVAHEAAHIVSGDCLETTVITSMFALYGDLLSNMDDSMEGRWTSSSKGGGSAFIFLIYFILKITLFIANLMKMFISREREYRADAIAVRLSRDPLSLAQALYLISTRWRGANLPGDEMDSIFIVNPRYSAIEEQEGFFADMFSTHPPVLKRIGILLDMAHTDMRTLQAQLKGQPQEDKGIAETPMSAPILANGPAQDLWKIYFDGQWQGPFTMKELSDTGKANYDSFVNKVGTSRVCRLFEDPDIKANYVLHNAPNITSINCPRCNIGLSESMHKGALILRCPQCLGCLMKEMEVKKLLARQDYTSSDKIKALAMAIIKEQNSMNIKSVDLMTANLYRCPYCNNTHVKMLRNFYTIAYPVEIDRCIQCNGIWFDKDELEVLEYLIEYNTREFK